MAGERRRTRTPLWLAALMRLEQSIPSDCCVEFLGVGKSYGDTTVLRDIDLCLPSGVTTAIVGASGSGKTTLLRLINALETVDTGTLRVAGKPIPEDLTRFRRGMGYAVQGAGLLPHLSVLGNVTLVARLAGWQPDAMQRRAEQLLEQMNLPAQLWDRFPGQLSGGQQQRVGLCRALMLEPDLLLLDEPFSAVDPITRLELHEHFAGLQKSAAHSTIMVTHDMREAEKLAEHLVILADGSVAQAGPTAEVIQAPDNDYVARLLAEQLA